MSYLSKQLAPGVEVADSANGQQIHYRREESALRREIQWLHSTAVLSFTQFLPPEVVENVEAPIGESEIQFGELVESKVLSSAYL